jgi:hypothetical protein
MSPDVAKSCALALIPSIITLGLVQACGGSSDAVAQAAPSTSDPIEGVWEAVASRRDCTTGAVTGTFRGAQVMHRGGTLSDTNIMPTALRGPGWGIWSRNADGTYAVKFRFYTYNADGTWSGTAVVTSKRTLNADGTIYNGDTSSEVLDTAGTVIARTCVTDVGTKFK